jgi:hypothetical protein
MSKISIILVLALLLLPAAGQIAVSQAPHSLAVTLLTNASGNASEDTRVIQGELLAILYKNGNFTEGGNVTIEDENGLQIDIYNVSPGNAYRSPGLQVLGSTDAWRPYVLASKLWLNMTGQQDNKTATVQIFYR